MNKFPCRGRLAVAAAVVALVTGCGDGRPERVPVSGQVLINGQPLTRGYIRLVHPAARPSWGDIDKNGRFVLTCFDGNDGVVPGTHQVEIAANEPMGDTAMRWFVPKKYANYQTSGVSVEITQPTDSLVIKLEGEGLPFVERFGR